MAGSWLDDFSGYLETASSAIETVQKVIQPPPLASTTVPVQAQTDVKTAAAQATDAQPKSSGSGLLIVAVIAAYLILAGD